MKHSRRDSFICWFLFSIVLIVGGTIEAGEALTYPDLVKHLTDLGRLATLPDAGETTAQFSSYDRASRYDEKTGKYINWDANDDGRGFIRKEGNQFVFAEMTGPGCIDRIWSAAPGKGHVRIYLDGDPNPVVDLPFEDYFSGKSAPFNRAAIVHEVSRGWNNYTPIPYQKSCKIMADDGWGAYFHFGYTTFPADTTVPTFTRNLSAADNAALDDASKILAHCGPLEIPGAHISKGSLQGANNSTTCKLKDSGAITGLCVKLDSSAGADWQVLRALTLQICWDGEKLPAVWSPLGDFFGTALGANIYRSLPCGYTSNGWFYANWFMPFTNGAEIKFANDGINAVKLRYEIETQKIHGDLARYTRFHAKWHRDALPAPEPERAIDWTLLKTTGTGRFVGVMLHIWNPRGGWWGEGDEKFFVDGEKFPSTFGTGSEDYFGYAWGDPALFQNAYHNQTHNDGNNRGHISVNRWHISDQVPFQKQFEGDIEKYFSNARPTTFAATVYWYLTPGGSDPFPPQPLRERLLYLDRLTKIHRDVIEAESLKVSSLTGGNTSEQDMSAFGDAWSNNQLWWTGAKPGAKLELVLPVAKSATYQILAQFTKAIDYGIVQVWLDGAKFGEPLDLFHDGVIATGNLVLGQRRLNAGDHQLTLEIIGANPAAVKSYMVGLDYLKLVEAQ